MKEQHKQRSAFRPWIAVVGAISVVAAAGGGLFLARHRSGAAKTPVTNLAGFRLGDQIQNTARLKLALEMGTGTPPQELELTGNWSASVTDIHDGLAEVACAFSNVHVSVRQNAVGTLAQPTAPPEAERQMAEELSQRFFISYRADGAVVGVWFPRELNPSITNLLLTVASARQLVHPANTGDAWIVSEHDVNGQYTAAYQQTGLGQFIKQKAAYLEPGRRDSTARMTGAALADDAPKLSIKIEKSKATLHADDAGRLLGVEQAEALAVDLGGMGQSFRMTAEVTLAEARIGRAPQMIGAFAAERATLQFQPMDQMGPDSEAQAARRDRALLGATSFDELMIVLGALPARSGDNKNEVDALSARFEAEFRLHPESAARAAAAVPTLSADHGRLLVDALLMARGAAAQGALGMIAKDAAVTPDLRQYAILYIPRAEAPTERAVAALRDLLGDPDGKLRRMAALAYGACGHQLRAGSLPRATRITQDLLSRFNAEKNEDVRADLIVALGNAGDPAALPALRSEIANGAALGRNQAIGALRYIIDPAVDPLLTTLLQDRANENVRLAAIGAVRYREVGAFAPVLADMANADPVESVRHAAIDLLGSQLRELPGLRAVLERARNDDPAERIREVAARYLAASPQPG